MGNLIVHELRSRWKGIIGWTFGLILFGAMYIWVWPQAADQMVDLADLSIYQAMGINLRSFEGYIGSVVILFLPLLLGIYSIVTATRALVGEEDEGTLELVMARPIAR